MGVEETTYFGALLNLSAMPISLFFRLDQEGASHSSLFLFISSHSFATYQLHYSYNEQQIHEIRVVFLRLASGGTHEPDK